MKIGIVGLGYVGLPLAVAFAEAEHDVVGRAADPTKVGALNEGRSYVEDVPDSALAPLGERLRATTEAADLEPCEAIVICVPTPLTGSREPDLAYLNDAAAKLAAVLRRGQLVVLESTTYPGTTRERLAPLLERGSGLEAGADFHLAFSPERIDPGRTDYTLATTPKLVGGLTAACAERARALYSLICERVIVLSSPEAAELAKLLENIFRSVNIALVNELSQLCDRLGIEIWEVIEAAASKPFGFMRFDPGPGMGGHCLPVDPFYLAFKAREHDFYPEFIELAGKVNRAQPAYCVDRIARALNDAEKPVRSSNVLILGVSYKPGVGDIRESPALEILTLLQDLGAAVTYHDPHVPDLPDLGLASVDLGQGLADADIAAIVTAHPQLDYEDVVARTPLTIDFRGVTRNQDAPNLVRL
jgi:UDP-N-acetyl-D-glucosamine dehydrogenase